MAFPSVKVWGVREVPQGRVGAFVPHLAGLRSAPRASVVAMLLFVAWHPLGLGPPFDSA